MIAENLETSGAYLQEISDTSEQFTGSSTAVTPSLEFYV
jgi:hypothetical protein